MAVGLTAGGTILEGITVNSSAANAARIVLLGEAKSVQRQMQRYESLAEERRRYDVTGVPLPAGVRLAFPPAGVAYRDHPESHYVWRWIATRAPDLVLLAGAGEDGLAAALTAAGIPARSGELAKLSGAIPKSAAHRELDQRVARTPRQVVEELLAVYGKDLPEVTYIPALALMTRLRMGQLAEVEQLVAPYRDGARDSLANATESHLGGHLLFAALAAQTSDPRYVQLVNRAADVAARETLHNEMSDSIFMSCPLLARTGKLTGNTAYFDFAVRHWQLIANLCLRGDGLYRHSPLNDTAWGRGNAFPALGLAFTLADLPVEYPGRAGLLRAFQNHMAMLAQWQDESGMWRQVVDRAGAYPELSATAMIGTAMLKGVRAGWLDQRTYGPRVERAWHAVLARTSGDGVLSDVCESTGKQKSVNDYLQRAAIQGRDARGGAMVLLFAAEWGGTR